MEELIKSILAAGPKTVSELVAATGKGETTVRKAVNTLTTAGALTKDGSSYSITPTSDVLDDGSKRKRGRPIDPFVRVRDARAFEILGEAGDAGITVATLAEKLEVKPSVAYLSVWRLRSDGQVHKVLNGTRQPAYAQGPEPEPELAPAS